MPVPRSAKPSEAFLPLSIFVASAVRFIQVKGVFLNFIALDYGIVKFGRPRLDNVVRHRDRMIATFPAQRQEDIPGIQALELLSNRSYSATPAVVELIVHLEFHIFLVIDPCTKSDTSKLYFHLEPDTVTMLHQPPCRQVSESRQMTTIYVPKRSK